MIVINIREINVKSMSGNSGIYIGSNFDPNRVTFTKLNANIFGNNNKNNLNIIIDNDGLDFVVVEDQDANQTTIKDDEDSKKIVISKKKNRKRGHSNAKADGQIEISSLEGLTMARSKKASKKNKSKKRKRSFRPPKIKLKCVGSQSTQKNIC